MNLAYFLDNTFKQAANQLTMADDIPEIEVGDLVHFQASAKITAGGYGVVKTLTTYEFMNAEYDPTDDTSELFITLPCAIVVSALEGENWLDYVPLTLITIVTANQIIKEYMNAFSITDEADVQTMRLHILGRKATYHPAGDYMGVSKLPVSQSYVSSAYRFGMVS